MHTLETLWFITTILTLALFALAWFWLAFQAFREHYLWGLAVLFLPMAQLVFAALHWNRARKPIFVALAAFAALFFELLVSSGYQALHS